MQGSNEGRLSAREKKRRRAASSKYIYDFKQGKICMDCQQPFPPEILTFDHVRGRKQFNISQARDVPLPVLIREISKTDLVCLNCHKAREILRKRINPPSVVKTLKSIAAWS